ncbi:tetratricopeptide repeat protein, partial [bacterium]|nr:tetratricopeptide repeat protein [bacterium]
VLEVLYVFTKKRKTKTTAIMKFAASVSSLAFGFSSSFWSQCIITEVYALNILLTSSVFYFLLRYLREKRLNLLYLSSFLFGLGLTNHQTMVLFAPLIVIILLFKDLKIYMNFKAIIIVILFFSLGFSIYLYFPMRAAVNPLLNWGDPENLAKFKNHLLRSQYEGIETPKRTLEIFYDQILKYIELYIKEFSLVPFLFFLFGFVILYKNHRFLFFTTLGILLSSSIFFILYTNFQLISRDIFLVKFFFIPSYLSLPLCIGALLYWLYNNEWGKINSTTLVSLLGIAIFTFPFIHNYYEDNRKENFITLDYGRNLVNSISKNGIAFMDRDMEIFTLYYMQLVEGLRRDITVYDRSGILRKDLYGDDFSTLDPKEKLKRQDDAELALFKEKLSLKKEDGNSQDIYYVPPIEMNNMNGYELVPSGILYEVKSKESALIEPDNIYNTIERGIADDRVFKDYTTRAICMVYYKEIGDNLVFKGDTDAGFAYYDKASDIAGDIGIMHTYLGQTYSDMGQHARALEEHRILADLDPGSNIYQYNLGLAYLNLGDKEKAKEHFQKSIGINPRFNLVYNQLGKMAEDERDYERAAGYYHEVMKIDPKYPDIYNTLGDLYIRMKDYDTAINYLSKVLSFLPKYPEAIYNLARAYEAKGEITFAAIQYRKACELSQYVGPNPPDFMKKACERFIELKKEELPMNTGDKTGTVSEMDKAQLLTKAGQLSEAAKIYEDIIKKEPKNKEAYNMLGYVYDLTGKPDQAQKMYLKAIEIDPKFASAYNNLGASCANQKKYKLARQYWQKAVEFDPSMEQAKGNLRQMDAMGLGKE